MKKTLCLLLLFFMAANIAIVAGGKKKEYRYEIVPVGVGSQGSLLIKVYSYAKNEKDAIELAKENAVHGVLFKGVVGGNGASAQPAIVKPEEKGRHSLVRRPPQSGQFVQNWNHSFCKQSRPEKIP